MIDICTCGVMGLLVVCRGRSLRDRLPPGHLHPLQARTVAEPIIATVALMAESGLPCFGRGLPVENLRRRFHLEMTERQAAEFMRRTVADAYDKWTTGVYDVIQHAQNKIPY